MGNLYGYIRVSTREQNGDRQILALKELFIPEKNLFMDTRRGKDLMGTFLSDIVLQVLSFVAENERINIRQRQAEGIGAAKARGIRFGRPPAPLPENFHHLYHQWKNGKITGKTAAKLCGMPLSTFRYRAEIYEKKQFFVNRCFTKTHIYYINCRRSFFMMGKQRGQIQMVILDIDSIIPEDHLLRQIKTV